MKKTLSLENAKRDCNGLLIDYSEIKALTGLHFTVNHTAKMSGLSSISTACSVNPHCIARREAEQKKLDAGLIKDNECVCLHCYAFNMLKRYKTMSNSLENNAEVLTSRILSDNEIPKLYSITGYFRFEAFGDLINEIQVINYFKIANANPDIKTALWTKNPQIIAKAIKKYNLTKPENLVIIGSSYNVNEPEIKKYQKYDFIDNIFTVYTKDYAKKNNIKITCGGNSCAACGKCYNNNHSEYNITELLK